MPDEEDQDEISVFPELVEVEQQSSNANDDAVALLISSSLINGLPDFVSRIDVPHRPN